MLYGNLQAAFKFFLLSAVVILYYLPVRIAHMLHKREIRDRMIRACQRSMLRITGVQLNVTGTLSDKRPLLLVSNHLSYLDIFILASQATLRFTPKSEIADWSVIGHIC